MAYFYIEAGGTRTSGGSQTKKTGAWSSIAAGDKYDTPKTCADDASPPVAGDIVCWKTDSTDTISVDTVSTFASGVTIIATSASDCDVYAQASSEQLIADGADFYNIVSVADQPDNLMFHGVNWAWGDHSSFTTCQKHIYTDTTVRLNRSNDYLMHVSSGGRVIGTDSSFEAGSSGTTDIFQVLGGAEVLLTGGEAFADVAATTRIASHTTGGGRFYARGVDFSASASGTALMEVNSSAADSRPDAQYFKCKLPAIWTTINLDVTHGASLLVESCDSRYQYEQIGYSGDISWVEDVYYTSHSTMDDGSTKGSLYFDANANCSPYAPLKYGDYSSGRWLMKDNQSAATLNTLRVFFVTHSADSLDKGDVQIECIYADTADTSKGLFAKHINPIINDSPGALSTETTSAKWTDSGSNSLATTSYYFDLDLTIEGDGLVYWTLALTKADVEMWLSWECEFV